MEDTSLSITTTSAKEGSIHPSDWVNCLALSLDPRAMDIVNYTADIEEYLGLEPDRDCRIERLQNLQKQALVQNINPTTPPLFSEEVDKYCQLLRDKVSIMESMLSCCDSFVSKVRQEMALLDFQLQGDKTSRDVITSNYIRKYSSRSMDLDVSKRQKRNRLPSSALHILWDFMKTHKGNPYPTTQQKEMLAKKTNLTITQIRNWFTNTRKRKLSQSSDSDDEYSFESDQEDPTFNPGCSKTSRHPHRSRRGKKKVSWDNDSQEFHPSGFLPLSSGIELPSSLPSHSMSVQSMSEKESSSFPLPSSFLPELTSNLSTNLSSPSISSGITIKTESPASRTVHPSLSSAPSSNGTWNSFTDDNGTPFTNLAVSEPSVSSIKRSYEEDHELGVNLLLPPNSPRMCMSPLSLNEQEFFLNNDMDFSCKKKIMQNADDLPFSTI